MAHWHDFNPWADNVIYLPDLAELSACLNPDQPLSQLERWERERDARLLDAYILPQPDGQHSCGIRWGKEGEEYYSPYIDPYIASLLISKYGPRL